MLLELAFDSAVEVLELGVAIRMVRSLQRLAVGLQTVPQIVQHPAHPLVAGSVSLPLQFLCQLAQALTGPPQRRFRITARDRFHQSLQVQQQRRVLGTVFFRPPPGRRTRPGGWMAVSLSSAMP